LPPVDADACPVAGNGVATLHWADLRGCAKRATNEPAFGGVQQPDVMSLWRRLPRRVDRDTDLIVADDDRWDSVRLLHTATLAAVAVNGLHVDWRLRTYPAANGELRFRVGLAVRACLNWVGAYDGPWLWPLPVSLSEQLGVRHWDLGPGPGAVEVVMGVPLEEWLEQVEVATQEKARALAVTGASAEGTTLEGLHLLGQLLELDERPPPRSIGELLEVVRSAAPAQPGAPV
jgi:hypothetical protein